MLTSDQLLDELDRHEPPTAVPTGFAWLDDLVGGLCIGQVWVVTGTPGQGKTTLLVQWAALLAGTHRYRTILACPREDSTMCAGRLVSCLGKVPLLHLLEKRLDADDLRRAEPAREVIMGMDLLVAPSGTSFHLPTPESALARTSPWATVIDDADLVPRCTPERIRELADAGGLVILSLPRDQVVATADEDADLDPAWARIADVVLEVRSRGLVPGNPDARPGEADLTVLKNRRGPTTTAPVGLRGHYSRFVDLT